MLPRGYFFVEIWYNMPEVREMALREIRKSGDEILRKKSREIQEVTDRVRTILDDMAETMYHAEGGALLRAKWAY